ncbi:hypothetical protein A3J11_00535 [Candidatus Kaiserbacteria bacterium RIFCSPLOWO2_02_FULL_55_12]|uniref:Uncharacterized protein n=1 Tax=Candidatus Kaiserbacteria bacterium RIFCSPLOWO2_02_FULL_55_12 TaxID=1798522 RepID=A0A1F6EZ90_9BACT|nr:MAG: hypothetical protein A3J11_00535 [Candidatus Kaiserbacteria bacterium RIFCSPLOWO2_02_FULL_55_12]
MNKPTQQQIIEAYKKLPPPVREFLADPDQLARVLTDIKNTHNLHVDVIGQVNESIGYLLLGLVNLGEFKDALKAAGVPEGTINEIIAEINQKIFVSLHEQMRSSGSQASASPQKSPAPPVPASRPTGVMGPPPQSPRYFHLENKLPAPARPAPRPMPAVPPVQPLRPLTAPRSGASGDRSAQQNGLAPRPMDKMLEDHEEPHIDISEKVQTVSTPPSNLPGVLPPRGMDPYREPIDEK